MSERFNIATISRLINVPKSTLRYWDSEGLIHLNRNEENNYREYSIPTMFEILDILSYRMIHMPIKEIKELEQKPPHIIFDMLNEKEDSIQKQIETLQKIQNTIKRRKDNYIIYQTVMKHPYEVAKIPFHQIIPFHYDNKEHWIRCQKDNTNFVMMFKDQDHPLDIGLIENEKSLEQDDFLWKDERNDAVYIRFILKASFIQPEENNLSEHLYILKEKGIEVGTIIGQLLFTAYEEDKCDYYLAWAEVIRKSEV